MWSSQGLSRMGFRMLFAGALAMSCTSSESTSPSGTGDGGAGSSAPPAGGGATTTGTGGTTTGSGGTGGAIGGTGSGGRGGAGGDGGGLAGSGGVAAGTGGTAGRVGATGRGGTSGTGAASSSGGQGGSGGAPAPVQLATSIPKPLLQPVANPGMLIKQSYPVYYYLKTGAPRPPNDILPRQDTPITKTCNVYLPPGYTEHVQYPIIFILHGINSNEDRWSQLAHAEVLLDNLITSEQIQPIIAVFPRGTSSQDFNDTAAADGYYVFGNELVNDLIPFMEKTYPVKQDREFRAISGFSMGGMQTINIGLCQNLKTLAWFGAFAPAPTTYTSDQIVKCLQSQNQTTSYPVNFFYVMVGESDGTAGSSTAAAVNGLPGKSSYLSPSNFAFDKVPGSHDYPTALIGLYNFVRIAFHE